jgi:hypothetical protein
MSTLKVNTLEEATVGGATYFTSKAWVTFDGTGTVAIRDDGNVGSIVDNGTGDYTVDFDNDLSTTTYAVAGAVSDSVVPFGRVIALTESPLTASRRFEVVTGNNTLTDEAYISPIFME